eukprot:scpid59272/ scgid20021/ Adenylyl cyclase-associated protein 2
MSADRLEAVCARLEAAVTRLEKCGSGSVEDDAPSSESLDAFDEIVNGQFAKFLDLSKSIGGEVAEQAKLVKGGFQGLRSVLVTATKHSKPSSGDLQALLKPISIAVQDVTAFREKNRASKLFNHLSAISESIGAIGWVAVSPKPAPYCKQMAEASQFYGNRVLKDFKGTADGDKHTSWVRSFSQTLNEVEAFIKKYHTTGLVWNAKGSPATASGAGAAAGGPPPPPAAAPKLEAVKTEGTPKASGPPAGLFAALNKGDAVTTGLKKVSKDQMTHKNPALRGSSVVKAGETSKTAAAAPKATAVKKPPKCARTGNKWEVEWHDGNKEIVIDDTATKQIVYIYKCTNSTIQVKGKVNNITLDSCKKTAVVFEDVIASLDIINCQSVQAQVTGITPIVNIDKTDGCQVYLSEQCKNAPIITAKSSEMNVMVPKGDGDYVECALPEQYQSKWNGKHFVTEPTEVAA